MIVEFHVSATFLYQTTETLPKTPITIEQLDCRTSGCRAVTLFGSDNREAIEAALSNDDTVRDATHVAAGKAGHWYSIETDDHILTTAGQALLAADSFLLKAVWDDGDWTITAQFPNKSTVLQLRDKLVDNGVDIDVKSFSEETETTAQFGVTNPQQEVLLLALKRGYFTVPRDASLSDLASELDISSQAASERIRRGTRTLVRNTLGANEQSMVESPSE